MLRSGWKAEGGKEGVVSGCVASPPTLWSPQKGSNSRGVEMALARERPSPIVAGGLVGILELLFSSHSAKAL